MPKIILKWKRTSEEYFENVGKLETTNRKI